MTYELTPEQQVAKDFETVFGHIGIAIYNDAKDHPDHKARIDAAIQKEIEHRASMDAIRERHRVKMDQILNLFIILPIMFSIGVAIALAIWFFNG